MDELVCEVRLRLGPGSSEVDIEPRLDQPVRHEA
jgi:hypothetical protein